jgi:arginine transport system substrate-binding protein
MREIKMKKFIHYLLVGIFGLLSGNSFAVVPPIIHFATEATYPPFEYMDASGEIKGFDIDLAKALCAQIKAQCTFTNQPWESLIPSLKLGKFDALISAMNITEQRKQQVDFTRPYFITTGSFVAPKDSNIVISVEGLKNKTVGVQSATTFEHYLTAEYGKGIGMKSYPSSQDALLDLTSGRVDVVLGDTPIILDWLSNNNMNQKYRTVGEPINNPAYFGLGYGIAVKKGNVELLNAFNSALAQIKANGDYDKLLHTYFPKS